MRFLQSATVDLQGAIDGVNQDFRTTLPMAIDTVVVFINGICKIAAWSDGFSVVDQRTVRLNEPPIPGDSVQVGFDTTSSSRGGALGGVPSGPSVESLDGIGISATTLLPPAGQVRTIPSPPSLSVRPLP